MTDGGHLERASADAWPKPRRSFGLIPRTPAHIKPAPGIDWLAPPPAGTPVVRATTDAAATITFAVIGLVATVVFELVTEGFRWVSPILLIALTLMYQWGWRSRSGNPLRAEHIGGWSNAVRVVPAWQAWARAAASPVVLVVASVGLGLAYGDPPPTPVFGAVLLASGLRAVAQLHRARRLERDTGSVLHVPARWLYLGTVRVWARPADTV